MAKKHIFIIAGESSGDQHAASYVREHKKINKDVYFSAIGQQDLLNEGVDLIFNSELISVVGIIEVISKYYQINSAIKKAYKHIIDKKPDLIILVDYVEFNLKIARFAKQYEIPVLFYVAPQVWAWREKRIKKIIEVVDHLAVVFPFEEKLFRKYMQNVTYVGHPLADNKKLIKSNTDYDEKEISVGIFPGSRESEIKNNLFSMIDCIRTNNKESNIKDEIKIFYSNDTAKKLLLKLLPNDWSSLLRDGKNINEIKKCKKAITASGTITLELAIINIPMVIMYRLSPLTYFIMKNMIKLKYIGLVNLILGESLGSKPLVKEFIQPDYTDEVEIMVELQKIDKDENYRKSFEDGYSEIRNILKPGAATKVAEIANTMLK
tara:strand:+ start:41228 stop:42361 length:1134 start_codon:yes stop_codon:yes gene_type:complete